MLSGVHLIRTEHVIPQCIGCCADSIEEADQILSQTFKSADKHIVRFSKKVVETKGVVSDSGAANAADRLFRYVRNIFLTVVNLLWQHLDQSIESVVIDAEVQCVSGGTFETDLSIFTHPGD